MGCPRCGAENATSRKFCRACGAALAPVCPRCATANEPGDQFCGECGAPLTATAPPMGAQPVAPPAPPSPSLGAPRPAQPHLSVAEERRLVTILFADLVGFTALAERLDAEEVRELTTECLRRLTAEAVRFGGTLDKLIGDCAMVLFGAPLAHEDDAARALRAALGMQRALETFNDELEATRGPRLALRIGIESGEVVAGARAVGGLTEYTVIGDAVNVAARLQGAAEPGTILVGETTARLAGASFAFRPLPPLALKNKDQPVPAAVLLGVRGSAPEAVQRAPLVGRTDELQALEACLAELQRGRGQLVAIIGEPGLGKSRLLAELRERYAGPSPDQEPGGKPDGLRWVRAQAFAHEQTHSYGLTRTLLRGLLGPGEESSQTETAERLRARLERAGCASAYPILAHLLGLPIEAEAASQQASLPPRDLQRLVFEATGSLLGGLLAEAPLVIELDDLHWADPSSIDLLLELMNLAERAPVLFYYSFRPERDVPTWALRERAARDFPHRYTEVQLTPLSERVSAELTRKLLQQDELPGGLLGVVERAAGTPLWVEELIRTLIERGLLKREGQQWQVTADLEQVELPKTLQALIVARIDRLGEARPTLQTASVIGRRFGRRVLERVAGEALLLDEHLLRAQRVDLVRELAVIPEREYGFKHILTQEAAYGTLLVRHRRELHRRVAETLEELYPERLGELHAILAHHYARAEAWDRALEHARAAAETARAGYANREALEHYGRALAAAEQTGCGPQDRLALYEARAGVHEVLGHFEPARADYEAALRLAEQSGDQEARARLLGALGMLWGGHRDYQRGLDLTRQAAETAEAAGDHLAVASARAQVGVILFNLARVAESRRELQTSLELFRALEHEPGQAQALDILTMTSLCTGDTREAVRYGREASQRLEALGDRGTVASTMSMVGLALGYLGQVAAAETWIQRGGQIWAEIGARSGQAFYHLARAQMAELLGAYELMFREASAGVALAREIGHREWLAANLSYLGRAWQGCGDAATAQQIHQEMLETARELGTVLWIAQALGDLGHDAALAGDDETATRLLTECTTVGGDALFFTAHALAAQAELSLRQRRPEVALERAQALQERIAGLWVLTLDARRIEGEALVALGRLNEAEQALRQARDAAATLKAEPTHWRACLGLGLALRKQGRRTEAASEIAAANAAIDTLLEPLAHDGLRRALTRSDLVRRAREAAQQA